MHINAKWLIAGGAFLYVVRDVPCNVLHYSLQQWACAQFDMLKINGGTIVNQRTGWQDTYSYKEQNKLID